MRQESESRVMSLDFSNSVVVSLLGKSAGIDVVVVVVVGIDAAVSIDVVVGIDVGVGIDVAVSIDVVVVVGINVVGIDIEDIEIEGTAVVDDTVVVVCGIPDWFGSGNGRNSISLFDFCLPCPLFPLFHKLPH